MNMSSFQGRTPDSTARFPASDSDCAEVLVRPHAPMVEGDKKDERNQGHRRLPDGAHIVFSGSDEEDDDTASLASSDDSLSASAGPSTSAYGSSMFEVSSTGASNNAFWPARPDFPYGDKHIGVAARDACQSNPDGARLQQELSPRGVRDPHVEVIRQASTHASSLPEDRKKNKKKRKAVTSKPSGRDRKRFNMLKILLIELCEEDPGNFDPEIFDLPDDVISKPHAEKKLRARLANLREAAFTVRAGGDKSVLLAARAQLGYGDRNPQGKLIKLKQQRYGS